MRNSDDATSTELAEELRDTMTGTALPWRAYPERFGSGPAGSAWQPGRETYGLCDGNGVTIARNMQRASPKRWRPSSTSASGCAAASK